MLKVSGLTVWKLPGGRNIELRFAGELVVLLGANGAGKTISSAR